MASGPRNENEWVSCDAPFRHFRGEHGACRGREALNLLSISIVRGARLAEAFAAACLTRGRMAQRLGSSPRVGERCGNVHTACRFDSLHDASSSRCSGWPRAFQASTVSPVPTRAPAMAPPPAVTVTVRVKTPMVAQERRRCPMHQIRRNSMRRASTAGLPCRFRILGSSKRERAVAPGGTGPMRRSRRLRMREAEHSRAASADSETPVQSRARPWGFRRVRESIACPYGSGIPRRIRRAQTSSRA